MSKEIELNITIEDAEVIMRGLMELPGKIMLGTMQKIELQVRKQLEEVQDAR